MTKLTSLTLVLVCSACGDVLPPPPPEAIIVIADLTTLTDTSHIEGVAQAVEQIVAKAPPGATVDLFPVHPSKSVAPIAERVVVPDRSGGQVENNDLEAEHIRRTQELSSAVWETYQRDYRGREGEALTCLVRTFERASERIGNLRGSGVERLYRIVVLSDLIEECADGPTGPLYMTRGNFDPAVVEAFDPSFSFADTTLDVRLHIVRSAQNARASSPQISEDELREAWDTLLEKMGFSPEDISRARGGTVSDIWSDSDV